MEFTSVQRVLRPPCTKPFKTQAWIDGHWQQVGQADKRAGAEQIARGYRTDHRRARIRITEQRTPGGFEYIAV